MKLIRFIGSLILGAVLGIAAAQATETNTRDLTATGGIPLWVFVDKVPFPNGMENVKQTLKEDILPNEAALAPVGGTSLKFDHREFQWRVVSLVDGYFNATTPGKEASAEARAQTRFQDSTGNYIDYLYSELTCLE